jgi:hypothetical protein
MPRARTASNWKELSPEERRERRQLRREKQREDNIVRAVKMHAARRRTEPESPKEPPNLKRSVCVGCSGWRLLEMAGFVLWGCSTRTLVRALPEAPRHRRNQRLILLLAERRKCAGLAASAR